MSLILGLYHLTLTSRVILRVLSMFCVSFPMSVSPNVLTHPHTVDTAAGRAVMHVPLPNVQTLTIDTVAGRAAVTRV